MQAKIIRRIFPFLSNYVNVTRKKDVVDLLNHYPDQFWVPPAAAARPPPQEQSQGGASSSSSNRSGFLQAPARTPSFKSVIPPVHRRKLEL